MYMWPELHLGEVREERAHIAAMGRGRSSRADAGVRTVHGAKGERPESPSSMRFSENHARGISRRRRKMRRTVLDVSAEEYYRCPAAQFERLYGTWTAEHP